ncbi:Blue-light-activated protein [Pseudobythopirellula maris]|uniref:histidine kinase n=1 Tax=Pseudobythopirellula maris TaxID=2527991 RepID=A0A5C5ZU49_9BACT|nr:PAS domain-containing hybrid sensor histidine kinase/response regulator [Pseudobythopirellula maris]TWT89653.1 Blue-light-activated protein [Pseudobythopirellula maris]
MSSPQQSDLGQPPSPPGAASSRFEAVEPRLRRAAEGLGDGLWDWDVETDEVWYSSGFSRLLGCEPGLMPPKFSAWSSRLHPADAEASFLLIDQHVSDATAFDLRVRLRLESGEYRWFRLRGLPVADSAGSVRFVSGGLTDLQEQTLLERRLEDSERRFLQRQRMDAIDSLAGGIAHEFNNVLQAVRGYVAFAMEEVEPGTQPHLDLEQSLVATDRAAALTRKLLAYTREPEFLGRSFDVGDVLNELLDLLRPVIGENIDLRTRWPSQELPVVGEQVALRQALLNLCVNARDSMPEGGELLVRAEPFRVYETRTDTAAELPAGEYCRIWVTDSGVGVPRELRDSIFDPFFTTKKVGHGAGLGLAVVRGVVDRFGGAIHVHSEPGVGASFCLILPVHKGQAMNDPCVAAAGLSGTVLWIEDEPLVREVGRRMLEAAGLDVIAVRDGEAGLEALADHANEIDLVVSDVVLPGVSGARLLEETRRIRHGLPFVFCTGYDPMSAHGRKLLDLGAEVIAKPFDRDALLEVVAAQLPARAAVAID